MPRTVTRAWRCRSMASRLVFASVGLAALSSVSSLLAAAGVTATSPRTSVFVEAAGGTAAFGAVNGATAAFMTVALVALVVIACVCIARRKCFNVDNGHVVEPKSVSASRRADILERWMVLHPPSLTPPDVDWSSPPTVSLQAVELLEMSPVSTSFVKHVHKAGWQNMVQFGLFNPQVPTVRKNGAGGVVTVLSNPVQTLVGNRPLAAPHMPQSTPAYFEITITRVENTVGCSAELACGFVAAPYAPMHMVGMCDISVGFHVFSGKVFTSGFDKHHRLLDKNTVAVGDTVGAGYEVVEEPVEEIKEGVADEASPRTPRARLRVVMFFTHNGRRLKKLPHLNFPPPAGATHATRTAERLPRTPYSAVARAQRRRKAKPSPSPYRDLLLAFEHDPPPDGGLSLLQLGASDTKASPGPQAPSRVQLSTGAASYLVHVQPSRRGSVASVGSAPPLGKRSKRRAKRARGGYMQQLGQSPRLLHVLLHGAGYPAISAFGTAEVQTNFTGPFMWRGANDLAAAPAVAWSMPAAGEGVDTIASGGGGNHPGAGPATRALAEARQRLKAHHTSNEIIDDVIESSAGKYWRQRGQGGEGRGHSPPGLPRRKSHIFRALEEAEQELAQRRGKQRRQTRRSSRSADPSTATTQAAWDVGSDTSGGDSDSSTSTFSWGDRTRTKQRRLTRRGSAIRPSLVRSLDGSQPKPQPGLEGDGAGSSDGSSSLDSDTDVDDARGMWDAAPAEAVNVTPPEQEHEHPFHRKVLSPTEWQHRPIV